MNHAKRLDKEVAERFVQSSGSISLGGFSVLDEAAAAALAQFEGSLDLDGLTALSDAAPMICTSKNATAPGTGPALDRGAAAWYKKIWMGR